MVSRRLLINVCRHPTVRLESPDTSRNEHERKNAVDRQRGATRGAGRQESREHVVCAAVENVRIVEASGQVREHGKKGDSASDERYAAGQDRSP
jgi:hypothetical protein